MKRFLWAALLLAFGWTLCMPVVHAQAATPAINVTFRWTPPTEFLDETPIPKTMVIAYDIYAGPRAGARVKVGSSKTPEFTLVNAPLDTCFVVRAVISGQGTSAAQSGDFCLSATIPKAVSNLQWVSITVQDAK